MSNEDQRPTAAEQAALLREWGFAFLEVEPPAELLAPRVTAPTPARATEGRPHSPAKTTAAAPPPVVPTVKRPDALGGKSLPEDERIRALAAIAEEIAGCKSCGLCRARNRTVPGVGNPMAELVFVGEGPGADEDAQGIPFVGKAGQLLTKIIGAMSFSREEVFIANIVKCRPPGNRVPEPEEMKACLPYLLRQLEVVRPKVIVALGATAVRGLLPETSHIGITKLRGNWLSWHGIKVMPTFHPSYLLRSPSAKRPVWEDMQTVMAEFGRKPAG